MRKYSITLDDQLVMQAESTMSHGGINLQQWLNAQVESLLTDYIANKDAHRRRRGLSDEQLAEELKVYEPLTEQDFPELTRRDYAFYMQAKRGSLPKGLERWL